MNARAQFKAARSLYRHGMRTAPVFIPGDIESNFVHAKHGRYIRPECQEAMAMASRLNIFAPQFLPRIPAAPLVSTLRTLYRSNNPRMYTDTGSGRKDAGHPYKRQALNELRTGMLLSTMPILPGPVAPLAELFKAEARIWVRHAARDIDQQATRDLAVASRTLAMGFDAIFGKKAA